MTVVALDGRSVILHVEHRRRGWHGRMVVGGADKAPAHATDAAGATRACVLADLLDALLAAGVDVDPCCAIDGEGKH